ncbi:hypothetical protein DdX_00777 [Ditylenchus destructor]|uniref:Uncharacterized protein n=1 Tax=Ditylenchus destructor TaxID=166010 RepID=A0AAD4R7K2_9BILA|nr:hypothetical protein DdX_00777 [Ditylenchus destructor]
MLCLSIYTYCYTLSVSIFILCTVNAALQQHDADDAMCVNHGTINIDSEYETKNILRKFNLIAAGLEYPQLAVDLRFRVFVIDGKDVYKQPKIVDVPNVTDPNNIRLFFENGKDLYVFYILENRQIEGRHFHLDKSSDSPQLILSADFNLNAYQIPEGSCKDKCNELIFGHSGHGFYFSSCISLVKEKPGDSCGCIKGKYCVYDPALNNVESTLLYNHSRVRNAVMCNLIVENNKTIFIEDKFSKDSMPCFTKADNLYQVQFWKDGWEDYGCCRTLITDSSAGDCNANTAQTKTTAQPKPGWIFSQPIRYYGPRQTSTITTIGSSDQPADDYTYQYITPPTSAGVFSGIYYGSLIVVCILVKMPCTIDLHN